MHLASDEGPCCAESTVRHDIFLLLGSGDSIFCSYVQELEARLLHMESLFQKIAPTLQNGQSLNGLPEGIAEALEATSLASTSTPNSGSSPQPTLKTDSESKPSLDDDVSDAFGQLALDEYGHMRWIGGSSTMSLIQSFKALTTSPLHRISPMEEDPQAPGPSVNKLYFPAAIFFGKVDALPGPEEAEYPDRDLADRLVGLSLCPMVIMIAY